MDERKEAAGGSGPDQELMRPDNALDDLELPPEDSEHIVGGLPAVQKKLTDDGSIE